MGLLDTLKGLVGKGREAASENADKTDMANQAAAQTDHQGQGQGK